MKLSTYVDELNQLVSRERGRVDSRLLVQFMNEQRSIYLKNEFNQGRSIDDVIIQSFPIELNLVSATQAPIFSEKHTILKSNIPIPTTINRHYNDTIVSVRNPVIGTKSFNYISFNQAPFIGNGLLNRGDIYCFIYNNYLYIKTSKFNSKINTLTDAVIDGVFEDPRKVMEINNPGMDYMKQEYPITLTVWTYIREQIVRDATIGVISDLDEHKG